MYAATIAEFTIVYIMVLAYTFCIVPAFGSLGRVTSPFVPIVYACDLNDGAMYALAICGILLGNLQTVSSTLVTSRFIYALARDCAIPFSNVLVRTTKEKEPLAADLAIILALYASVASWWVSAKNYYQLVIPFLHWFTCVPYTIVLVLFISSRLQLEHVGRTQFTLGRWTRPLACVAALWGILVFIQGSMPSLAWTLLDVDGKFIDMNELTRSPRGLVQFPPVRDSRHAGDNGGLVVPLRSAALHRAYPFVDKMECRRRDQPARLCHLRWARSRHSCLHLRQHWQRRAQLLQGVWAVAPIQEEPGRL